MALADYYARSATAASQVLAGFDEEVFRDTLSGTRLEISFGNEAATSGEGRALLDLLVRLAARLYPSLRVTAPSGAELLGRDLSDIARGINPAIETGTGDSTIAVSVGRDAPSVAGTVVYAGSDAWDGLVSTEHPCSVGSSNNPFGAGAAACIAMANVFRVVFLRTDAQPDRTITLSVLDRAAATTTDMRPIDRLDLGDVLLVGAGAIGNGALWALARAEVAGRVHIIDHEILELSNLQRYVLASRTDDGALKVDLGARHLTGTIRPVPHPQTWAEFVHEAGYAWPRVLVALDSAAHRRAVQASLPKWIANAWTQAGDLGLSIHPALAAGACLACLYLPSQEVPSEDALIATALRVPDRLMQIRELLYRGAGTPRDLLESASRALDVPLDRLLPFEGKPLRSLYVEGVCGGTVIPLDRVGAPPQAVHVPLAHQSALAGVLLAGGLVGAALGNGPAATTVTRVDLMHPIGEYLTQPARKDATGRCFCNDGDYIAAYEGKYPPTPELRAVRARRRPGPRHTSVDPGRPRLRAPLK